MDNQYTDPQLFALMKSNYNLISVVTCRANRKEFDSFPMRFQIGISSGSRYGKMVHLSDPIGRYEKMVRRKDLIGQYGKMV